MFAKIAIFACLLVAAYAMLKAPVHKKPSLRSWLIKESEFLVEFEISPLFKNKLSDKFLEKYEEFREFNRAQLARHSKFNPLRLDKTSQPLYDYGNQVKFKV
jgi:hypothetical protein